MTVARDGERDGTGTDETVVADGEEGGDVIGLLAGVLATVDGWGEEIVAEHPARTPTVTIKATGALGERAPVVPPERLLRGWFNSSLTVPPITPALVATHINVDVSRSDTASTPN